MSEVQSIFRKLQATSLYNFSKQDSASEPFAKVFQHAKVISGQYFESFTEPLKLELI